MSSRDDDLLRGLHVALEASRSDALDAALITRMAESLGFHSQDVLTVAERLQADGLIQLRWGGGVALTDKGRVQASGRANQPSIQVGEGAVYVGGSVTNAAVGKGAMKDSVRIESHGIRLGELAAALELLRSTSADLKEEERVTAEELEVVVEGVLEEARQPTPEPPKLEAHLDRAKGVLERLGSLAEAGGKLAPVLQLVRTGLGMAGLPL